MQTRVSLSCRPTDNQLRIRVNRRKGPYIAANAAPLDLLFRDVLGLASDERPDFIDLNAHGSNVLNRRIVVLSTGSADALKQAQKAPFDAPVMRKVARTEQPSTNAEMTAIRFSVLMKLPTT
jgi:hypothetical protein